MTDPTQAVVELCECEAAMLVLRTDGTLYRFLPHQETFLADSDSDDPAQGRET